jgi:prefoldin subunit 5
MEKSMSNLAEEILIIRAKITVIESQYRLLNEAILNIQESIEHFRNFVRSNGQ